MAHSPITPTDPLDPADPLRPIEASEAPKRSAGENPPALTLMDLASTLSAHGGGALSADLALDLVLNDIVEQARLATNATAAAIALAQGDEIVCRATTGTNAPDLGVRLDAHSGLSGASVQTKTWQRCNDTEADPRVNAEVCRNLGVRSILVFPVIRDETLLGVIEIFSARPNAFSDREVQTLEALAREVISNLDRAAEVDEPSPAEVEQLPTLDAVDETALSEPITGEPKVVSSRRDPWTTILMVLIIGLAMVLGWMLHNVYRQQARQKAKLNSPIVAPPAPVVPAQASSETNDAQAVSAAAEKPNVAASQASRNGANDASPAQGLTVYQNGKVIFRLPSAANGSTSPKPAASGNGVQRASDQETEGNRTPEQAVTVSPEVANQYLLSRVEPDYPDQAREQHIQGAVILEALVGKDGTVSALKTISGDPMLAAAATQAVQQWRFKPLFHRGQPEEFQTRITVSFRLP
jgi:TonB family protein